MFKTDTALLGPQLLLHEHSDGLQNTVMSGVVPTQLQSNFTVIEDVT